MPPRPFSRWRRPPAAAGPGSPPEEDALWRAEARFEELLAVVPEAILVVEGHRIAVRANRRAEQMFGAEPGGLAGVLVEALFPAYGPGSAGVVDTPTPLAARRLDGTEFPANVMVTPLSSGDDPRQLFSVRDASVRTLTEEALVHHALHDPLTGLPNRMLLLDRLTVALASGARSGVRVGVLFVDLDRFKLFNDSRGHAAGDALLRGVAQRLQMAVRPGDTVARFGGDEFAVVCGHLSDEQEALRLGERILHSLREPFNFGSEELFLAASVGIAIGRAGGAPESLLRDADAAMYRAKQRGRNRCELFDATMRQEAASRLATQSDLRRALERDELAVVYQPVVALASGSVVAVEALVRWFHPQRGLIPPDIFVPMAEEGGLIIPIGNWVLEQAVAQSARWRCAYPDRPPLVVHVNLSPRQLHQPEFLGFAHFVLARYGVDPATMCFELTETVLMEDLEHSRKPLTELRDLGARIALDDFGTGYSSLTYLKRFPVDLVKIDRTFVRDLATDTYDSAIVHSVVDLAHAVGLRVVAEGIETTAQLERLLQLGCDEGQGYLFSKARPPDEIDWLLAATYPFSEAMLRRTGDRVGERAE